MRSGSKKTLLKADGKFFRCGTERIWLKAVTYGPFPAQRKPNLSQQLAKIGEANFNTIRVFELPELEFLDEAYSMGLRVFVGLDWRQYEDFISQPSLFSAAKIKLISWLKANAAHPAIAAVYVGNEIPADLVRWMGPVRVRQKLEELIEAGRETAPSLLFSYANYPSTEYLEPSNADFTAFNVYLEEQSAFSNYLARLQNIAGDRPLVISEFGIDSLRNGEEIQAKTLKWALETANIQESAGLTVYAWSDLWFNNGKVIDDWNFGITSREGIPKPALQICEDFKEPNKNHLNRQYSVIVCTRNGAGRISACLEAIEAMYGNAFEIIVVDDGSSDATSELVTKKFPSVRLIKIQPSGLSAARNLGSEMANGEILAFTDDDCEPDKEWLIRLNRAFEDPSVAAAGGPNLAPRPRNWQQAVIQACLGAPSHVLLDDQTAEHLPGCNISVRKKIFREVGGFDPQFKTAGDDVDFCWRLGEHGHRMAFVPGAFVWHWRRHSISAFLKQQVGYGKAERLLISKHPDRFSKSGEAQWEGFVYGGGPVRVEDQSIIYHGPMGSAEYQSISNHMLPLRPLDPQFSNDFTQFTVNFVSAIQPIIRSWYRNRSIRLPSFFKSKAPKKPIDGIQEFSIPLGANIERMAVLNRFVEDGWEVTEANTWDLKKEGTHLLIALEKLDYHHVNILLRFSRNSHLVQESLETLRNSF
ncbi:MAG: glycosyltransferase [Akkermansiaceae bacterium]